MASLYDRYVLQTLISAACGAPAIMAERACLVPRAQGRTLEIGVGGLNLPFYDPVRLTSLDAADPSPALLARAARRPLQEGLQRRLRLGIAEAPPFDAGQFDTQVSTLYSVQAPEAALAEAHRALRPGGQLLFCELGLAPDPEAARWRRRLEPLWRRIAGGCRLTRTAGGAVAGAGFTLAGVERGSLRGAPTVAGWCERGVAFRG